MATLKTWAILIDNILVHCNKLRGGSDQDFGGNQIGPGTHLGYGFITDESLMYDREPQAVLAPIQITVIILP